VARRDGGADKVSARKEERTPTRVSILVGTRFPC
jgi:hypothetical protein